ncbi:MULTISPECIES: MFS transporter [Rhodococcus]|uniref:Drug resistance efflux protein n=2 Tax=Rhodococcus TaxID=1827 RepID=A0A1B1KHM4_RHOOP|nr:MULTISPECIES: MFS transporter [Rhodococcus]ANS32107.1 drug resistance efflux protein [Rhodococcus opacus]MDV6285985.1 MFS transporter [Rhodococcus jostii]
MRIDTSSDTAHDCDEGGWTPRLICSLVTIVLLLEMLAVSYMMISIALPEILAHYETTQGAWLLTAFLLVGAISCPLVGKLADMHGKRRLLLACTLIAALGSLLSALATTYPMLIAGRALTGLLTPCLFLSYSLIRDVYPKRTVPMAVSIATSGMGVITVLAPFLAGWLIDGFGYRSIFWFAVIGLTVLAGLIVLTTDESSIRAHARLDLIGAPLLSIGLAAILVAISFGSRWGWTAPSTLGCLIGGAVLLGCWIASARVVRDPLIDLRVLRRRTVALTTVGAGACYGAGTVFSLVLPLMCMTPSVLGLGYGFDVTAKGFAVFQAPFGAATMLGGILVGVLVRRVHLRQLMAAGLLIETLAALLSAGVHDHKILLIVFIGLFGLGQGLIYASIPNLIIAAVAPQLQATSASIVAVAQALFAAIGPILAFVLLNAHIALAKEGEVFYTDRGITLVFVLSATVALIGAVAAYALPRSIRELTLPDADARTSPTRSAANA